MSKLIVSEIESTGTTVQINDDLKVGTTGTNAITSGNVVSPSEDMIKFFKAYETPVTAFDAAITGGVPGNSNAIPWEDAASGFTSTTALAVTSTGNSLLTNFSADAVFLYKSSGTANCKNDYWGITIDIPKVYRGQNITLNFDYRTENASTVETAADQWFIAVQDKTNTVKTTVTDTALVSAGAAVTVASKAGLVVGDKIWLEGGGNAQGSVSNGITQTYITSISGTANEITLSQDYTPASTAGSIAVVGYLSDTLDLLAAADSDTDKVGKNRKLAFKTADDTAQVNVWFQLRNTSPSVVYSLFMDNIYISANKFLQASSKGQAEWVQLSLPGNSGTTLGRGSTNTAIPYGRNEDYNSISKYGTFENSHTLGISFTASVKCVATMTYTQGGTSSMWAGISKNSNQLTTGVYSITASHRIASHYEGVANAPMVATATVPLEPGDVLRPHAEAVAIGDYPYNFDFFMSVEPEVNDVIILESQDEIFTDWVDDGTFTTHVGQIGGAAFAGTFGSTKTNNTYKWRRDGGDMIIRFAYGQSTAGSTGTANYVLTLPDGYSADLGKIKGYTGETGTGVQYLHPDSGFVGSVFGGSTGSGWTWWGTGVLYNSTEVRIALLGHGGPSSGWWGNGWEAGNFNISTSTMTGTFRIPIQGWNANFNPLLSMPLVEIGANTESYLINGWTGRAASNVSYYSTNTPMVNTINNLGAIVNNSTDGFGFTASQRVKVDFSYGSMSDTYQYVGIVKNSVALDPTTGGADNKKIITGKITSANDIEAIAASAILEPGESLWIGVNVNGNLVTSNYAGSASIVATKDYGNTNMAHIIKPAVAIIREQLTQGSAGGTAASGGFNLRNMFIIEGESWFLSGATGTLGVAGTNTQIDLEAGTYEIDGYSVAYSVDAAFSRFKATDDSVSISGTNMFPTFASSSANPVVGTFTITETKTFQFHTYTATPYSTYGLGVASNVSGKPETYMQLKIRKLK